MIHDDLDDFMMEFKDWILFGGQFKNLIIQKSLKPKLEMDLHMLDPFASGKSILNHFQEEGEKKITI